MQQTAFLEARAMARPAKKSDEHPQVVTVKIHASLHSMAKKIAAFTDKKMEDLLSDLLREPLTKLYRKTIADAAKEEKP